MKRQLLPLALVLPLVAAYLAATPARAHPTPAGTPAACADKTDPARLHPNDPCYADALVAAYRRVATLGPTRDERADRAAVRR